VATFWEKRRALIVSGPLGCGVCAEGVVDGSGGNVLRPYRPPAGQPTVAKRYSDGRLALAWPEEEDEPADQDGVEGPLPDLLIVDITIVAEPRVLV